MSFTNRATIVLALLLLVIVPGVADDELAEPASWQVLSADDIRQRLDDWLAKQGADAGIRERATAIWERTETDDHFDLTGQVAATLALIEPRGKPLIEACQIGATPATVAQIEWLDDDSLPQLARDNFRLLLGRRLRGRIELCRHVDRNQQRRKPGGE